MIKLHRPMIHDNEHGTLVITDNEFLTLSVSVRQLEEKERNGKIVKSWRHANISGPIEPMIDMEFYPNMFLPGKIKITETFEPVIKDEPELFIKYNPDGTICRVNGKVVYRTESYTQDHLEPDVFIEE